MSQIADDIARMFNVPHHTIGSLEKLSFPIEVGGCEGCGGVMYSYELTTCPACGASVHQGCLGECEICGSQGCRACLVRNDETLELRCVENCSDE